VRPAEQHVHNFLESLPFTAVAAVACLHWDELRHPAGPQRWLARKEPPLPRGYLPTILTAVTAFVALPYADELLRCWRHR
jgi:hypothetical protein